MITRYSQLTFHESALSWLHVLVYINVESLACHDKCRMCFALKLHSILVYFNWLMPICVHSKIIHVPDARFA